jgi:hypothetical protein
MSFLLAGAESVPQLTSTRVAGYRRSHRGGDDAQLFAQTRTLWIRQANGLDSSIADSTSLLPAVAVLPLSDFHKVLRAESPERTSKAIRCCASCWWRRPKRQYVRIRIGDASTFIHLAMRRHKSIAKVAMGRRLAVRLYWMWRNGCEYSPSLEFGSYAGQLGIGHGVK